MSPKTNPSFNVDGKTITDKNVIANVFCRYFSTVANSLKRKSIYLREFVWKKPGHHMIKSIKSFKFSNISERDVFIKLRKLKRKKACGYDELPSGMLRDFASVISAPLAHIINMSLSFLCINLVLNQTLETIVRYQSCQFYRKYLSH